MNWVNLLVFVVIGLVAILFILGIIKAALVYFFGVSDIVASLVNIENLLKENNTLLKAISQKRRIEDEDVEEDLYNDDFDDELEDIDEL
jgi:hypothetical protein